MFLVQIVSELSRDASSIHVRAAVFEGLNKVLENHLSHRVLEVMLPTLSSLIHDKSEKVRAAFCHLLLGVKPIRTIQFYNVVPVEHLLQRLALDSHTRAVSLPLTELLVDSYFPQKDGITGRVLIERCIFFVQNNVDAAVAFYSNLEAFVSLSSVAKFICLLHRYICQNLHNLALESAEMPETGAAEEMGEALVGRRVCKSSRWKAGSDGIRWGKILSFKPNQRGGNGTYTVQYGQAAAPQDDGSDDANTDARETVKGHKLIQEILQPAFTASASSASASSSSEEAYTEEAFAGDSHNIDEAAKSLPIHVGLLKVSLGMWTSIAKDLGKQKYRSLSKTLADTMTGGSLDEARNGDGKMKGLAVLFDSYSETQTQATAHADSAALLHEARALVLKMAGLLPETSMLFLKDVMLKRLTSLKPDTPEVCLLLNDLFPIFFIRRHGVGSYFSIFDFLNRYF
jgi:hypothetical protein